MDGGLFKWHCIRVSKMHKNDAVQIALYRNFTERNSIHQGMCCKIMLYFVAILTQIRFYLPQNLLYATI